MYAIFFIHISWLNTKTKQFWSLPEWPYKHQLQSPHQELQLVLFPQQNLRLKCQMSTSGGFLDHSASEPFILVFENEIFSWYLIKNHLYSLRNRLRTVISETNDKFDKNLFYFFPLLCNFESRKQNKNTLSLFHSSICIQVVPSSSTAIADSGVQSTLTCLCCERLGNFYSSGWNHPNKSIREGNITLLLNWSQLKNMLALWWRPVVLWPKLRIKKQSGYKSCLISVLQKDFEKIRMAAEIVAVSYKDVWSNNSRGLQVQTSFTLTSICIHHFLVPHQSGGWGWRISQLVCQLYRRVGKEEPTS